MGLKDMLGIGLAIGTVAVGVKVVKSIIGSDDSNAEEQERLEAERERLDEERRYNEESRRRVENERYLLDRERRSSEEAKRQAEKERHQQERATRAEHWVFCAHCGRKFDYTKEPGGYDRKKKDYYCKPCKHAVLEAIQSEVWKCNRCGGPSRGLACEYCDSPRETHFPSIFTAAAAAMEEEKQAGKSFNAVTTIPDYKQYNVLITYATDGDNVTLTTTFDSPSGKELRHKSKRFQTALLTPGRHTVYFNFNHRKYHRDITVPSENEGAYIFIKAWHEGTNEIRISRKAYPSVHTEEVRQGHYVMWPEGTELDKADGLEKKLRKAGFTNIVKESVFDLRRLQRGRNGEIIMVSVDGDQPEESKIYLSDRKVFIRHHSI